MEKQYFSISKENKIVGIISMGGSKSSRKWALDLNDEFKKPFSSVIYEAGNIIKPIYLYADYKRKIHAVADSHHLIARLEFDELDEREINSVIFYIAGCSHKLTWPLVTSSFGNLGKINSSIFEKTGIRSVKGLVDFYG